MADTRHKKDKIQPLIRVRQIQMDQAISILNRIQKSRESALRELQHFQQAYIVGIDRLNQERQSPERKLLETLEQGVDYAKAQWYKKLKTLRSIEQEEKAQKEAVLNSHQKLRMLEKLDARYDEQNIKNEKVVEQKQLDEFALQISRRKSADDRG